MQNCNSDYSQYSANTGIAQISVANSNLDGTGTLVSVITGASNGTRINRITIKAKSSTDIGMVRFFIQKGSDISLFSEVPIPISPYLLVTPTPMPYIPTFETTICCNIDLANGDTLLASTQSSNIFNVIVDAVDWNYQSNLPPACCSFRQSTATSGICLLDTANSIVTGYGTNIPPSNGSIINSVKIKALGSTSNDIINIYVSPDNTTFYLLKQILIPITTQSSFTPSYVTDVALGMSLESGFSIGFSASTSQLYAITVNGEVWNYPTY